MNKNLFKSFAVAALSILAAGCAKEQVTPGEGETTEVSFNVEVPGVSVATKGISDAASVDELICQVYIKEGAAYKLVKNYNTTVANSKASLQMTLVKKQQYYIAFWAQCKGTGYYNTDNLQEITINYDAVKANEPKMDAFAQLVDLNLKKYKDSRLSENVDLYRAVAQINFGQETLDRIDAMDVSESSISLTGVPDKLNILLAGENIVSSKAFSGSVDIAYKANETIKEKLDIAGKDYDYLASAYVFAPNNRALTNASATFKLTNGYSTSVSVPNVPFQRNYRTNILGDLLTTEVDWNIKVDNNFKGGNLFYNPVGESIAKGGEVTLEDDFSVVPESNGLAIKKGVSTVLNLNGKKFENRNGNKDEKAALQVRGSLTINGDGDVICEGGSNNNAVLAEDGGHLIINGGTYYVEKDAKGKSNATIYARKACTIEINGGLFSAEPDAEGKTPYVLNQEVHITENCFSVKGGIFIGFNPADVNECQGKVTSFVAEGYRSVETTYNGKQAWKVEKIPAVTTQEDLESALSSVAAGETATVYLGEGKFTLCNNSSQTTIAQKKTLVFVGQGIDKTSYVIGDGKYVGGDGYCDYSVRESDVTFKNMTVKMYSMTQNYQGFAYAKNLRFENCRIEGRMSYLGVGSANFIGCTFVQIEEDYNLWTYSGKELLFENCIFNSVGKFINVYKTEHISYKITVKDCKFISSKVNKSALELKANGEAKYEVYFAGTNACTDINKSEVTGSMLYNSNSETDSIVYIDGKKVWENGAKVE